jgi:hypothetical protein
MHDVHDMQPSQGVASMHAGHEVNGVHTAAAATVLHWWWQLAAGAIPLSDTVFASG